MFKTLTATVLLLSASLTANAAPFLTPAGGGTPSVYELENGNYLGLWGISDNANDYLNSMTVEDLLEGFGVNKDSIVAFFYATPYGNGEWAGTPADFTQMTGNFSIQSLSSTGQDGKLWDSFWVEWTGGNLFNAEQRANMAAAATMQGSPELIRANAQAVSEPGILAILALGAGLLVVRRKK